MTSIAKAVALVTGANASGNLGTAVANALVRNGATGVIAFDLAAPAAAGAPANSKLRYFRGDVTSEKDVSAALDEAEKFFGETPRVVVNCAGIAPSIRLVSGKGEVHSLDVFERTLRVNVLGSFNVMRLSTERMIKRLPLETVNPKYVDGQRGVVINTASIAAYDGQIGQVAYSASKGAVVGMCLPAARDLAQHHVRVVTVAPGVFKTPMVAGLPEKAQASLAAAVPYPARLGDPNEFAEFVMNILNTPLLNGEVVRLDGALRLAPR